MKKNILAIFIALAFFLLLAAFSCNPPTKTPTSAPPVDSNPIEEPGCQAVTSPDGAELILIQAGAFKMGSPDVSPNTDEKPLHLVSLGCYSIYKNEVTNSLYTACVKAGKCMPIVEQSDGMTHFASDPSFADNPAVGVDYNMATDYCTWIGGRLPTEAQWEYAALGATNQTYPWGNTDPTCENADFKDCQDPISTIKVGSLPKGESPFKVDDLSGNAFEWVFDWYAKDYYANSPASNPVGPLTGVTKVIRGGSFTTDIEMLRGANRHGASPYAAYSNVGFRCVIQPGFELPADYQIPTPNKHDIPDKNTNLNGKDPGDPGDSIGLEFVVPPMECPDPNGKTHATVYFKADNGSTFNSLEILDGNNYVPFTCGAYDQNTHTYDCQVGPLQPNQTNPAKGRFCYKDADQMNICMDPYPLFKAQGCGPDQGAGESSIVIGCPGADNTMLASFLYDRPVTWESHTIANGIPMNCTMYPPRLISCIAPAITTNGLFQFRFEGFGQDGDYLWTPEVVPPDCSKPEKPWAMNYAWCDGTNVKMNVLFTPETLSFDYATVDGNDVQCAPDIPNRLKCSLPPSVIQGTTVPSKVCLSDSCFTENLIIPQCTPTAVFPKIDSFCDAKGAGIKIHFASPPSSPIKTVEANGTLLNCGQNSPTDWTCGNLPGQPGDNMTFKITLEDFTFIYPGQGVVYPTCETEGSNIYWSALICIKSSKSYLFATDVLPLDPPNEIISVELDGQQLVDGLPAHLWDFWGENLVLTPGETKSFKVCYKDGTCKIFDHVVPECGSTSAVPCPCRLLDIECINENKFGFIVQTCPANPEDLQPGSVQAKDSQMYSCDLIPGIPGRVYCAGPNPVSSTPLAVTFKHLMDTEFTQCFLENWPPSIPACPTKVPCSGYYDKIGCEANNCKWSRPASGGPEYCH